MSSKMRQKGPAGLLALLGLTALMSGCMATPEPKMSLKTTPDTKEYFSEAEYGVKASPRISELRSRLPRGGGRVQIGKPYKVHGRWYHPKEEPDYKKVGAASWYGDAFHGRLTANGEIYDMTHLTAAHPTMPLPSYARVTNMNNGSSVVVRVNDRGPFAKGRIIDLSKRAAQMLDYASDGVAKVQVEYVGRAPLDGHDEKYLLASYHHGRGEPETQPGYNAGVMIAMNGPTPTVGVDRPATPFPGAMVSHNPIASSPPADAAGKTTLPDLGPIVPDRPVVTLASRSPEGNATLLGYADERVNDAARAFDAVMARPMTAGDVVASWNRQHPSVTTSFHGNRETIAVGSYRSRTEAQSLAAKLSAYGAAAIDHDAGWYSVSLRGDGRLSVNALLETVWANGAEDAFLVRD